MLRKQIRKRGRSVLALLLLTVLLLALASCSNQTELPGGDTTVDPAETKTPEDPKAASLDLTQYQIVIPMRCKTWQERLYSTFFLDLKRKTGFAFPIPVGDKLAKETDCEILLDLTNRPESAEAFPENETAHYVIDLIGKKIVIRAENFDWMVQASERFIALLSDGQTTLDSSVFPIRYEGDESKWVVKEGKTYTASCEKLFGFTCPVEGYQAVQGMYYNGETYLLAMKRYHDDGHETIRLLELDQNGAFIRISEDLPELEHGNCINYNEKIGQYFVTLCTPTSDGIAFIDPETLTVTSVHELGEIFYAIGYNERNNVYVSGGGGGVFVWDADLKEEDKVDPPYGGPLPQGGFADDRYLYLPRSSQYGYSAEILVIDYHLKRQEAFRIPLDVDDSIEPEDMVIIDGEIYVVSNHPEYPSGGVVYHVTLHETENEVQ